MPDTIPDVSALAALAERLSLALSAAELGDWAWNPATDRIVLSPRAGEIFGVPAGDGLSRTQMRDQLVIDEDRPAVKAALERAMAERRDYNIEYRVRRPDGVRVWIAARGRGLYDSDGRLLKMLGVVQDVTARKQIEEERELLLKKLEGESARLRAAFMGSPAFMCVLRGPEHVFEFANERYFQLVGKRKLIGLTVVAALPEVQSQGYDRILSRVYTTGEAFVGRDMAITLQGGPGAEPDQRYLDFVYEPMLEPDGSVSGIFVHGVDITENKRIAEDRERLLASERAARTEAERANRMKDDFLATVSHELRTPLNAVLGWSQLLIEGVRSPEELQEGLQTIERNALAQAQIIDDLLDMSRIISGKMRLAVQPLDPADVIKAGVDTVRAAAELKGVRLSVVLDPLAGSIRGDPHRLQQVVWNLLSNAIKFTPKGGRVQVSLERVNSQVEFNVTDTGAGISPEFLPFVFDRFRQMDSSTTRQQGGLGLGLAIVKHLVELHGGAVRVKSPGLGGGATFTVALPLMAVADTADESEAPPRAARGRLVISAEDELRGVKVLVVDDERDTRLLVQRILVERGALVTAVGSATEAYAGLLADKFNVLVSDIGMPGEDGYSLIRRVRALPPAQGGTIPALALTAYARSEDRMRAIATGFQMHVVKPVETAELIVMVAALARSTRTPA